MVKKIIAVIAVLIVIGLGVLAYAFFRTPEAATEPIEAIPLDVEPDESSVAGGSQETETQPELQAEAEAPAESDAAGETEAEAATGSQAATAAQEVEAAVEADAAGQEVAGAAEAATGADAAAGEEAAAETATESNASSARPPAASPTIFEIVPTESEARFLIDEVLRGDPITVVGATDQVAGQFAVAPGDLSNVEFGVVQVNARTLATDNDFRNRAIKNRILLTDAYEFVTFTPTEIVGLPESGAVGEQYTFQVNGDLTITDVTRPVTFEVTATPLSETRIEGAATTSFLYTDFDLFIPDARSVDTVADEVRLELDFIAEAVQQS